MDCKNFIYLIDAVVDCNLVSTKKNGNKKIAVGQEWKLIPRGSDRVEAIGWIGVERCAKFCLENKIPLYVKEGDKKTLLPTTLYELGLVATAKRFQVYQETGHSNSMIDHFYDKLLHIDKIDCGSKYLQAIADERLDIMRHYIVNLNITINM